MSEPSGSARRTIEAHSADVKDADGQSLTFVSDWSSPFAQRTWIALEQSRVPYKYKEASNAQKATDHLQYLPQDLLPYLELSDGRTIRGSITCIEYLAEACSVSSDTPPLTSADPIERARQRVWTDWIRRSIIPPFLRVLRATSHDVPDASSVDLCKNLNIFAQELRGEFFSGSAPSLPDLVLAPFIVRAKTRAARGRNTPQYRVDAAANQAYQQYAERILELDSVKATSSDPEPFIDGATPPTLEADSNVPKLPSEVISLILAFTDDYELACTLGMPNAIPRTAPWAEQSTRLDCAILTGNLRIVQAAYRGETLRLRRRRTESVSTLTQVIDVTSPAPPQHSFSKWGARVMVRFGYVHLLDWLYSVEPGQMHAICGELLPEVASAWGRVEVLEWAHRGSSFGLSGWNLTARAMDDASRNGHVAVLEWWKMSGIHPLVYSEDALNSATIKQQIPALEWWTGSGLPLKVGNVLDFASMVKDGSSRMLDWWKDSSGLKGTYTKMALYHLSCAGNTRLLSWWRDSRLPLVYDKEVLTGATRAGKVHALQWWLDSRLPVNYTFFDVEEAIEDSIANREQVEQWWNTRGLRSQGSTPNWTKQRLLGR